MAELKIEDLSFEQALSELEALVAKMESEETKLEDSIGYYVCGLALSKHCKQLLSNMEQRIEKVEAGGETVPLEEI
ncbi:exodeoxyribonuclease VII small subunit [Eubacteriales bacterium OttesenSCG-928-N14]|nr:exodeoxyribonuclease VII small subunit [Eubacteriales bacterium OttesenSCG-928-N14]